MKSVVKFDRISVSIDVSFVRMISHFPLFLPTLRDLVANVMHRLWNCILECCIYTTNIEMALRLTLGTLQIQLEHWFCHRQLSHYTQSRTLFYLWRSREWLTLSSVLEIVHYYDVCPFTIFFSWPSWSYGSWIYNYLCNQCLSFHHLCSEFEFWFPPPIKLTSTI